MKKISAMVTMMFCSFAFASHTKTLDAFGIPFQDGIDFESIATSPQCPDTIRVIANQRLIPAARPRINHEYDAETSIDIYNMDKPKGELLFSFENLDKPEHILNESDMSGYKTFTSTSTRITKKSVEQEVEYSNTKSLMVMIQDARTKKEDRYDDTYSGNEKKSLTLKENQLKLSFNRKWDVFLGKRNPGLEDYPGRLNPMKLNCIYQKKSSNN